MGGTFRAMRGTEAGKTAKRMGGNNLLLPDHVLRRAQAFADARGLSSEHFIAEALDAHFQHRVGRNRIGDAEPPWMMGFGELSDLSDENRRVLDLIEEEFGKLSPEEPARSRTPTPCPRGPRGASDLSASEFPAFERSGTGCAFFRI